MAKSIALVKSDIQGYLQEFLPTNLHFIFTKCFDSTEERNLLEACKKNNEKDIDDHDVVLFAKVGCGYCEKAKKVLKELQEKMSFSLKIVHVKGDKTMSTLQSNCMQRTLKKQLHIFDLTYPQIIIAGYYIGGADDLLKIIDDGRFAQYLEATRVHSAADTGRIVWDEDLLSIASKPDLRHVPRVRSEGAWYPTNWPYYVFQWTVHANLIRYISILQIILYALIWVLIETDNSSPTSNGSGGGAMESMQQSIAIVLLYVALIDVVIIVVIGPSPFSPTGVISTYFGWKSRGNATSILPYKAVFAAYIFGCSISLKNFNEAETAEETTKALTAVQIQMLGYISNSALLGERAKRAFKQRRASAASIKMQNKQVTGTFCRRTNRITHFHSLRSPYFIVAPRASRSVQRFFASDPGL